MDELIRKADAVEALKDALSDLTLSHREWKMTMQCLDDLPTFSRELPTLYGYDIDVLVLIVSIMKEKKISPEEAVDLFSNAQSMLVEIYREMVDAQKKAVEEICNRWEGGNDGEGTD